ncbi:hypothetical protein F6X00_10845 [Vibrio vulnificus]|uniref:hypothetical protein n=1 Tax=Vibrio vulnificus TaxID=672 RepID=UPI0015FB2CB2|nr:hypothetical protein [Vibrio vulnificus]QMV36890.1 hypothetical protein F6X00_10845 [Vibrio vulnificus]HDY8086521.1 hypothetical protein [Vibrio vulnificus]
MESSLAMTEFVDALELEKDSFGHCEFQAFVEYKSQVINATELTTVKFIRNGYNDGDIQLTESGDLTAEDFHLDLSTRYQTYSFNAVEQSLNVLGNSPKMGGDYTIKIKVM